VDSFHGKPKFRIMAYFRGKTTNSTAQLKILWATENCGLLLSLGFL